MLASIRAWNEAARQAMGRPEGHCFDPVI